MSDNIRLSCFVSIGRSPPGIARLDWLRQHGFRSVVDLRTDSDKPASLLPDEEARAAEARGMSYSRFPVSADKAEDAALDRFGTLLRQVPKPVFVHCSSGHRAGMFALTQVAVEQGMPGKVMLRTARHLGLLYGSGQLRRHFADYVDRRSEQGDPLAHRDDVLHHHSPPRPQLRARAPVPSAAAQPARPPAPEADARPVPHTNTREVPLAIGAVAASAGVAFAVLAYRRYPAVGLLTAGLIAAGLMAWLPVSPRLARTIPGAGDRPDEVQALRERLNELQLA